MTEGSIGIFDFLIEHLNFDEIPSQLMALREPSFLSIPEIRQSENSSALESSEDIDFEFLSEEGWEINSGIINFL